MNKFLLKSIVAFVLMGTCSVGFNSDWEFISKILAHYVDHVLCDRQQWTVHISNTTHNTILVQKAGEFWWNLGTFEQQHELCPGEQEPFSCYERGCHDNIMGFNIVILSDKGEGDKTIHYELLDPNKERDFGDTIKCYAECYYDNPLVHCPERTIFLNYLNPKYAKPEGILAPHPISVADIADYPYRIGKSIVDNSNTFGETGYFSDIGIRYDHTDGCIHCDVVVGEKKPTPPIPPLPPFIRE